MDRIIGNEEFESAYADKDNLNIIRYVCGKYAKSIESDELKSLGAIGLWKCLRKFKPEFGQKFTSFLYSYVDWECKAFLKERKKYSVELHYVPEISGQIPPDDIDFTILDDDYRKPIEQRIIGRMSFREMAIANGRSKESERQNWLKIMQDLREDFA